MGSPGEHYSFEVRTTGWCTPNSSQAPPAHHGQEEKEGDMEPQLHCSYMHQLHHPSILLLIIFCYVMDWLNLKNTSVLVHNIAILIYLSLVGFSPQHIPHPSL